MGERSDLLERLARHVSPPGEALERLLRRRERRAHRARLAAGAVAIALAAAGVASVVAAFRGTEPGPEREQVDAIAAAIPEGLEVPAGRFWHRELLFYGLNQCLDGALDRSSEVDGELTGTGCSFSNDYGQAQPDRYPYVGVSVHRIWWSPDGPAQVSERKLRAELFTEEERADFVERYGPMEPLPWETKDFGPREYAERYPDEDPAHGLSTDPEILAGQLLERLAPGAPSPVPEVTSGPGHDPDAGRLWRVVEAILPTAQPTLQAAMFEVMSDWPDTEVMTGVRDPVGRHASLLQVTTEGGHHAWWFDPDTHQVLANVETWRGVPQTAILVASSGFVEGVGHPVPVPASLVPAPVREVSPMRDPRDHMRPAS